MEVNESTSELTRTKSTVSFCDVKNIVRVGGGFLSIDEFLDQYTPAELEKIERKDPLMKFSSKVSVQKTLVGKELRESSPIRTDSPSGSPKRQNSGKSPKKGTK